MHRDKVTFFKSLIVVNSHHTAPVQTAAERAYASGSQTFHSPYPRVPLTSLWLLAGILFILISSIADTNFKMLGYFPLTDDNSFHASKWLHNYSCP